MENIPSASPAHPCPCCGYLTLPGPPGTKEVCTICMWWDDLAQLQSPTLKKGMNRCSLVEAQANFRENGVADAAMSQFNRKPRRHDRRDPDWRPFDETMDAVDPTGEDSIGAATGYYWRVKASPDRKT